jgi:hypothetical protein
LFSALVNRYGYIRAHDGTGLAPAALVRLIRLDLNIGVATLVDAFGDFDYILRADRNAQVAGFAALMVNHDVGSFVFFRSQHSIIPVQQYLP